MCNSLGITNTYTLYTTLQRIASHTKVRSLYKAVPLQAWSDTEGSRKLGFPDFMTIAQDGCKIVSLTHRSPLPLGNDPGTHFCYRLSQPRSHSAIGRILCQLETEMTPVGIEPATFRFVAQHLNHCATSVPLHTKFL